MYKLEIVKKLLISIVSACEAKSFPIAEKDVLAKLMSEH